jgi:translation initiation factor 5
MNGSDDPFYRYQMESIITKVEGNGKMIKTYITNIDKVSKHIDRKPEFLISYMGYEVGANSKLEKDKTGNTLAWIGGNNKTDKLQELCYKFINDFIICKQCLNPETEPHVTGKNKNTQLALTCKSCGKTTQIKSSHKIVKYMINHFD